MTGKPECEWCNDTGWVPLDDGYPPEPPHYIDTTLCVCAAADAERKKTEARRRKIESERR